MSCGICQFYWIIQHIAIPVQALRIGIPWHNRIRAQEAVNIRRKRPLSEMIKNRLVRCGSRQGHDTTTEHDHAQVSRLFQCSKELKLCAKATVPIKTDKIIMNNPEMMAKLPL
jgi:hypothetical protein